MKLVRIFSVPRSRATRWTKSAGNRHAYAGTLVTRLDPGTIHRENDIVFAR